MKNKTRKYELCNSPFVRHTSPCYYYDLWKQCCCC